MTITTEHFASFDGTRLAIHTEGEGRPVLLLHGLFSSAQMNWIKWGHGTRLATAGFRAIMLDFRVHGESEAPRDAAAYPLGVLVRDVAALAEHLALEPRGFDLAGFSLGARTAIHAVAHGILEPRRLAICGMGVAGLSGWARRADHFKRVIDEFDTIKPGKVAGPDGKEQAPHITVVIFMRGGLWGGLASLFEKVRGHRKTAVVAKEEGL